MLETKNIPYYVIAIGIFILFKFSFVYADTEDLKFLLKPTEKLIGLLTGTSSVYVLGKGYFYSHLNIVIDKSCAGFNFWVLSFLMLTFLGLQHYEGIVKKLAVITFALMGTYLFTVFVNTSRIFASIVIHNKTSGILENQQHNIHEMIGIATNLTFLILLYFFTDKFLTKKTSNA